MDKGLRFTLTKEERVSGEKRIEGLFANGRSFIAYPLRVVYVVYDKCEAKTQVSIFVSVPKKRIRSAVKRNLLKRLIRETYRLNKYLLLSGLQSGMGIDVAFVYVKDEISDFATVEKGMLKSLKEIADNRMKGEE
ncbi:MAG: ribonuclease P protein component [Dysgonamonadaceae bacterium]|jgi:ribonuclease P protein component|nr:ribonuclease P protein component [Dysgonamonadaceae bacterium]